MLLGGTSTWRPTSVIESWPSKRKVITLEFRHIEINTSSRAKTKAISSLLPTPDPYQAAISDETHKSAILQIEEPCRA